jgi:hypothetical protein
MSVTIATEKRMLTGTEFEVVERTHYPQISELAKGDLDQTARLLRDYRNKARDVARQQRREMRGKAAPRGAQPARDNTGTAMKRRIFSDALQRVNSERTRIEKAARRESQSDIMQRALEMKRANRTRHHPSAGRTTDQGMQPVPNQTAPGITDPREVGRVSQFVKAGQARRDG